MSNMAAIAGSDAMYALCSACMRAHLCLHALVPDVYIGHHINLCDVLQYRGRESGGAKKPTGEQNSSLANTGRSQRYQSKREREPESAGCHLVTAQLPIGARPSQPAVAKIDRERNSVQWRLHPVRCEELVEENDTGRHIHLTNREIVVEGGCCDQHGICQCMC